MYRFVLKELSYNIIYVLSYSTTHTVEDMSVNLYHHMYKLGSVTRQDIMHGSHLVDIMVHSNYPFEDATERE